MAVIFALLAALSFGCSDFFAGLASRAFPTAVVTCVVLGIGTLTAAVFALIFPGSGVGVSQLACGALSGVGSAVGTFSLYHALAVGRMSVVATVSAVLSAVLPVIFGVALGESLSGISVAGILIAIPAIGLVSWQAGAGAGAAARNGVPFAVLAGFGFALLFIALDRAGTSAGTWPVVVGQAVGCLLVIPPARRAIARAQRPLRSTVALILTGGVLSAGGDLLFLAAVGHGQLAIVAVISSLYPAATVLLARAVLAERWTRVQAAGLVLSLAAIVLVSVS